MASISVVIATWQRARMLAQAVEAALAQSRPPEEIVISDDASRDETPALLAELAASHPCVRAFRRETNSGGVGNWNGAMRQARGDYLALCSDDDRFLPGHLEASAAYLDAHPEAGFVHSGFIDAIEDQGEARVEPRRVRSRSALVLTRSDLVPYLTRYYDWPVHPSTIVMRRRTWEQVGEFSELHQLADTEWFARAAARCTAVYLPRHGVLNRRHRGNWSNRLGSARMQAEIFAIVEQAIAREYRGRPAARAFWRAAWRAHARLRLAWTLGLRLRSGQGQAAGALWHGMLQSTGRRCPEWVEERGARLIAAVCERRSAAPPGVSPL